MIVFENPEQSVPLSVMFPPSHPTPNVTRTERQTSGETTPGNGFTPLLAASKPEIAVLDAAGVNHENMTAIPEGIVE